MIPSALNLRLQQLEANVTRNLELLNEYESAMLYESDPGTKAKYRRCIENLNQQRLSYEREFTELQQQLQDKKSVQIQTIASQLHQIDNKLNCILDTQTILHEAILSHFSPREQAWIRPWAENLDDSQVLEVEAVLEAMNDSQIPADEMQVVINNTQQALEYLRKNFDLPNGGEAIIEAFNYPAIDAKHALKVSIPIIPFILSYEGELGLDAGIRLREAWEYCKSKILRG